MDQLTFRKVRIAVTVVMLALFIALIVLKL